MECSAYKSLMVWKALHHTLQSSQSKQDICLCVFLSLPQNAKFVELFSQYESHDSIHHVLSLHPEASNIRDYWTEGLTPLISPATDSNITEYELLVLFDMGNAATKYRIVRNELCRTMKAAQSMTICPELFSQHIYLEPLKYILSVVFLACPVLEFPDLLRPLLSSPLAGTHLANLVATTPQLLEDILECTLAFYADSSDIGCRRCECIVSSLANVSPSIARMTRAILTAQGSFPLLCIQLAISECDVDEYIDSIIRDSDKISGHWLLIAMTSSQAATVTTLLLNKLRNSASSQEQIQKIVRVMSIIISIHQTISIEVVADIVQYLQCRFNFVEDCYGFCVRMALAVLLVRLSVAAAHEVDHMCAWISSLMDIMSDLAMSSLEMKNYLFFVQLSLSQNRMVALKSLISRDLSLDFINDFLPPQHLTTLIRLITDTALVGQWSNNDWVCQHFMSLPRPTRLDLASEAAGDWLWCLGLMLRCNCFASNIGNDTFLRETMLHVVTVCGGWHSWLQETIENWLNFCILRSEKLMRTVMCFMPHDIKNMTAVLVNDADIAVPDILYMWESYGVQYPKADETDADILDTIVSQQFHQPTLVNYSAVLTCYIAARFSALLSECRDVNSAATFAIDIRELPLRWAMRQMISTAMSSKQGKEMSISMISSLRSVVPEIFLPERLSLFRMRNSIATSCLLSRRNIRVLVADTLTKYSMKSDDSFTLCVSLLSIHPSNLIYAIVAMFELSVPSIIETHDTAFSEYIFNIWRMAHSLCVCSDALELATVNALLEIAHVHRPRIVPSYSVLVQEPLLLFRLPHSLIRYSGILKIVLFICRSLIAASRKQAANTVQMKTRLFQSRQSNCVPGSCFVRDATNGLSVSQYLLYQDTLMVKALLELWTDVDASFQGQENILSSIRMSLSSYLENLCSNDEVVQMLTFYGGMSQAAFELFASVDSLLWKLSLAVSQTFLMSTDCCQLHIVEAALTNALNLLRVASQHVITRQFVFSLPTTFKKLLNFPYFKHPPNSNCLTLLCIKLCDVLATHHITALWQLIDVFDGDCPAKTVIESVRNHMKVLQVRKVSDEYTTLVSFIQSCEQEEIGLNGGCTISDDTLNSTYVNPLVGLKRKRLIEEQSVRVVK